MTEDKADNIEVLAESMTVKPARAVWLWAAVIFAVLILLWFETRHKQGDNYNLLLNGAPETVGAVVSIDGKSVGIMGNSMQSGVDSSAFYWHVNDGKHVIEVTKDGFDPFHKDIDLHSQDYIGIELKKSPVNKNNAGN